MRWAESSATGVVEFARNVEESVKNLFSPGMLFEELGFRYFGPIDGHDLHKLCDTLRFVRGMEGPRVVHVMTQKGKGFSFAEIEPGEVARPGGLRSGHRRGSEEGERPADLDPGVRRRPHGPGRRAPRAGGDHRGHAVGHRHRHLPGEVSRSASSTSASPKGMPSPSPAGWPPRVSGRCCAIYSTFLQRAYDNVIHDVAVQQLPVIFCMDRAGLVGEDGQTHMGLYDIAYMLAVPGMTVTAPKDGDELIGLLRTALAARRPVQHPLSPRQGPGRARPGRGDPGGAVRHLGTAPAAARTSPSWRPAPWCCRRSRRRSSWPAMGSIAPW